EKALAIKPELAEAHHNLGLIRKAQGMVPEAVACFKEALSCKPDYPSPATHLAIIAWVNGELPACRNYLEQISGTAEKLSGAELKFVTAYRNFLDRLLKYRDSNATRYMKDEDLPTIYVVGDSHCLSVANTTVNFNSIDYLAEAKIVIGCKAWHLGNNDNNRFKYDLEKSIESIPFGAKVILMFGEIDCRPEEGIIKHYKKSNVNLAESIIALVANYFNYILRVVKARGIVPIICNVPVQLLGPDVVSVPDKNLSDKVLEIFNRALADNAARKQITLLDVYSFSKTHGGETDSGCHIDNHHLKPSVVGDLLKAL
ncbi:MAG: tetratricopeptide repeat protein, partial [Desulfobulbaceae bacterium]|nr:tetratricopeptide repeat protein [Desulfobulbaceae bacterium]